MAGTGIELLMAETGVEKLMTEGESSVFPPTSIG